jgi:hypothetical protein
VPNAQDLTAGEFHFNGLKRTNCEKLSESFGIQGCILFKNFEWNNVCLSRTVDILLSRNPVENRSGFPYGCPST